MVNELRAQGVRATLDAGSDPIKAKIADAERMKVHTMLVVGNRDLEAGNVSVRVHGKGNLGAKPRNEAIAEIFECDKNATVVKLRPKIVRAATPATPAN